MGSLYISVIIPTEDILRLEISVYNAMGVANMKGPCNLVVEVIFCSNVHFILCLCLHADDTSQDT
jgi:hypothetical protein